MVNPILGELEVKIGERTFILRPTFEGLVEMERRAECTLANLVSKIIRREQGINDIVSIVWGGIVGAADRNLNHPSFSELGQMVMAHGYLKLSSACARYVGAAYSGRPIDDIAEPEEAKKKIEEIPLDQAPQS